VQERVYNVWMHPGFIYNLTKTSKEAKRLYEFGYQISKRIIGQRKSSEITEAQDSAEEIRRSKIYIDQLYKLKANGIFNDDDVKDEMDTIILGVSLKLVNSNTE
jgi:hypothetical protein